jgi:hypothetical protein
MSTYLHPDLDALRARLSEQGFIEVPQQHDDFTLVYNRHGEVVMIDLPETEVHEHIEVHFDFRAGTDLLLMLGFPL